ncbi:MAG TPA: phage holin family protein, partial [Dehalococcoidia bacterium]|nr:phage holin family protein [Dehalococcoidia bacterium]
LLFVIALINLLIALLALVLPLWASALIFTLLFLIITGVLAYLGYRRLKKMLEHPMGNTIESLREDVEWAQRQLTPGER